jgi:hypothetical protein
MLVQPTLIFDRTWMMKIYQSAFDGILELDIYIYIYIYIYTLCPTKVITLRFV